MTIMRATARSGALQPHSTACLQGLPIREPEVHSSGQRGRAPCVGLLVSKIKTHRGETAKGDQKGQRQTAETA